MDTGPAEAASAATAATTGDALEGEWGAEAMQLLINPDQDLASDIDIKLLVENGIFTPSTAQTFFGDDTSFDLAGMDDMDGEVSQGQNALLKEAKDRLSNRKEFLIDEVKEELSNEDPAPEQAQRKCEFDMEKLMVDDLREELRMRGLPHSGSKMVLVKRLSTAVATRPEIPAHRMTKKRKRPNNKREPMRDEYDTEEEYQRVWKKWRETRDNNNQSVKRSRENAKQKKEEHEKLCKIREQENLQLTNEVQRLREQVAFLTKVLKAPEELAETEKNMLQSLIDPLVDAK